MTSILLSSSQSLSQTVSSQEEKINTFNDQRILSSSSHKSGSSSHPIPRNGLFVRPSISMKRWGENERIEPEDGGGLRLGGLALEERGGILPYHCLMVAAGWPNVHLSSNISHIQAWPTLARHSSNLSLSKSIVFSVSISCHISSSPPLRNGLSLIWMNTPQIIAAQLVRQKWEIKSENTNWQQIEKIWLNLKVSAQNTFICTIPIWYWSSEWPHFHCCDICVTFSIR